VTIHVAHSDGAETVLTNGEFLSITFPVTGGEKSSYVDSAAPCSTAMGGKGVPHFPAARDQQRGFKKLEPNKLEAVLVIDPTALPDDIVTTLSTSQSSVLTTAPQTNVSRNSVVEEVRLLILTAITS
jgi:hypothetical protein